MANRTGVKRSDPILQRLLKRIDMPTGPGGCWVWQGGVNRGGYGKTGWGGKNYSTHGLMYRLYFGPVPDGLQIDHLCGNPTCCNPGHLEAVTCAENQRRRSLDQTHCRKGHLFDEANTYIKPDGDRCCRACRAINKRAWRLRREAAGLPAH